jgi:hypothetical protein
VLFKRPLNHVIGWESEQLKIASLKNLRALQHGRTAQQSLSLSRLAASTRHIEVAGSGVSR